MCSDFARRQREPTHSPAGPQRGCGAGFGDPTVHLLPWHSTEDMCGVIAVLLHFLGVHRETCTG